MRQHVAVFRFHPVHALHRSYCVSEVTDLQTRQFGSEGLILLLHQDKRFVSFLQRLRLGLELGIALLALIQLVCRELCLRVDPDEGGA